MKNARLNPVKALMLIMALTLCLGLLAACGSPAKGPAAPSQPASSQPAESLPPSKEAPVVKSEGPTDSKPASESEANNTPKERYTMVEIVMKDGGIIKLQLDSEAAPITVENFVKLANEGFYDGLTFHRAVDGFMIQGGDPSGNGTGGPGYGIKGEFASNGWKNPISHVRGVISMARRGDNPDSAGSQFFITNGDASFLDGDYAAFGTVLEGMDVVDAIAKSPVRGDSLVTPPVIETIRVVEA